jgi:glutamate-1-semialdehyde 2,1-aminomutase
MPISLLTGRADVMRLFDEDVFFFTTFGGEALSLAAAKATIAEIKERDVCAALERQGKKLLDGFNQLAQSKRLGGTRATGAPCRSLIVFDAGAGDPLLQKSVVQQELIRHGVLWTGFHNMCFSHSDADVEHVLAGYDRALDVLASALRKNALAAALRGRPVQPVFRKTS